MALTLQSPEADALARELAAVTGEPLGQAVINALRERLARERLRQLDPGALADALLRIGRECAALPVLTSGTPDEILGYDQHGLPS